MITKLRFRWFKSIEDVEFEPGRVNVFIGANGSGKSNLLEALGILSAAVYGLVDNEGLLRRGVRPGVPALYKCAFSGMKRSKYISFGAWSTSVSYEVNLFNPINRPEPSWRYHTENLKRGDTTIVGRSPRTTPRPNPQAGLTALKTVDFDPQDEVSQFLNALRDFAIYTPDTNVLRGLITDSQQRTPLGLSGGQVANALASLQRTIFADPYVKDIHKEALSLIDWAKSFWSLPTWISSSSRSPSVEASQRVIKFQDRFMGPGRNLLTAHDASEGSLYVIFHAILAAHSDTPSICAVDNADHSLNPRLARSLLKAICKWYCDSPRPRQIFLTTQNPLALDGLPLQDDQVRLFAVDRSKTGRTVISRIMLDKKMQEMVNQGWTLSRLWVMGHMGGVPDV
jgi:hypothetical protein